MTDAADRSGLTRARADGRLVCVLCDEVPPRHRPTCPFVVVRLQVRELQAALWIFAAHLRDTLDVIDRVLDGDTLAGTNGPLKEEDR